MGAVDIAKVEVKFARLLLSGWPTPIVHEPKPRIQPRFGPLDLMLRQLPDSSVPETRRFWRLMIGLSEEIANDPHPLHRGTTPLQAHALR